MKVKPVVSPLINESAISVITDAIRKAPDMSFNQIPASSAIQGNSREFIYRAILTVVEGQ